MANKIKKNDTVTNNIQLVMGRNIYSSDPNSLQVVPANTELKVWKVKRDGTLYCSTTDRNIYYGTITLKANDVTKVNKPLPVVNVGDIYVCSWGYDQTNIDFYMVVEVLKSSVKVVSIGEHRTYTGPMQGTCVPNINDKGTKVMTKRINIFNNKPSFKVASYASAYPYNNQPMCFTEWA